VSDVDLFFRDLVGEPEPARPARPRQAGPQPPRSRPAPRPVSPPPPPPAPKRRYTFDFSPLTSARPFVGGRGPVSLDARPPTPTGGTVERALAALGVTPDALRGFAANGMAALRPVGSVFDEQTLTDLLRRLRYDAEQLVQPPHSYGNDAEVASAFGRPVSRDAILAMRTLLAIPGHFRDLARRAATEYDAYAHENLGWLLMHSLARDVRTSSGIDFWLPDSPPFVTAFPADVPELSPQVTRLIAARSLRDGNVDAAAYASRQAAWKTGVAGRMWRLETGRETTAAGARGALFYPEPFTIPPRINVSNERAQIQRAWLHRLADFDTGRTKVPLTECDATYLASIRLLAPISLRGVQLRPYFPSPGGARGLRSLNGLAAVRPAFEAAFHAIADLGWNDLLFETAGMGCFRGKKVPGHPKLSREMSEHSLGLAIDLNAFENKQNAAGSMDPRIVALFQAFRFRWGKSFPVPDPMHFEYAG
jgi:hypothetical protein